jgi:hypothetical protein
MMATSVLRRYQAQHRASRPQFEIVAFRQKATGNHFEATLYILKRCTGRKVRVASFACVWHRQAPWFDGDPELFVVHRLKPLFNVIDCFEHLHAGIVSKSGRLLQIFYQWSGYEN